MESGHGDIAFRMPADWAVRQKEIGSNRARSRAFPITPVPCDPLPASHFGAPKLSHLWSPASEDLRRSPCRPPPRPLWERSDFPDLPLQIGLGNPGEGCPVGRWAVTLAKPAAPARPRRRALAGAARIGDAGSQCPAVSPSPGFAKLAIPKLRLCDFGSEYGSPSETALSHNKGRGGLVLRRRGPGRPRWAGCVKRVALRGGDWEAPQSHLDKRDFNARP
jgi:hypothetical protein